MGRQRLSRMLLLSVMPLTFLVFSVRLAWTQGTYSASETPIRSAGLAAQSAAVPEAKIRFHPSDENLSLPFAPHQGQTTSMVRFRALDIGYHLPPINNAVPGLWQLAKIYEVQAKENHFIDNTPLEWATDISTRNQVHLRTPDPGEDLAYYGHRIPWAGPVILNIAEIARVHPRVFRVVEFIGPGLTFENPLPRGSAGNIHFIGPGQSR
jgi:hypothetical protein